MARVLVEVDIQAGLMESLELEWRGQVTIQKIDYQGIPFHCNSCRRTGHLRRDCPFPSGGGFLEDSMDSPITDQYMSEGDTEEMGAYTTGNEENFTDLLSGSFNGKLRYYCPSLYYKLSSWECDYLEKSFHSTILEPVRDGISKVSSDCVEACFDTAGISVVSPHSVHSFTVLEENILQARGDCDAISRMVPATSELEPRIRWDCYFHTGSFGY
jgi:hypothetical protein